MSESQERVRVESPTEGRDSRTSAIVSLLAGVDAPTAWGAPRAASRRAREALAALGVALEDIAPSIAEVPMEE